MHRLFVPLAAAIASVVIWSVGARVGLCEKPYKPEWESLAKHVDPEWFRDAKFGIYTHWGPITVPAEDGPSGVQWYGRNMYIEKNPTFKYHREKYGDQHTFGYKDIIPLFNPQKFDADAWAELFAKSGAKFAGPVAIHHDNYAMWDSAVTRWDSMDQTPHRDFTAELEKAIRKQGMRFIATFHHSFTWQYFEPAYKYDAADGKNADLYGEPHEPGTPPSKQFCEQWLAKINEVVEKYRPDMIWFDFGLGKVIPPEYQKRMFADYYNWAAENDMEVCVAHKHWEIHEHTGIIDFERGRLDKLTEFPWLTDTSVGPWFHQKIIGYKSINQLVDIFVDIVAKNGCLLLNVDPTADGEIPPQSRELLLGMGRWLKVNGEAIYNTRPWLIYGEGPTKMAKSGTFSEHSEVNYTAEDVRFTRSKDGKTFYCIVMDRPEKPIRLQSVKAAPSPGAEIVLLGTDKPVAFSVDKAGSLTIDPPKIDVKDEALDAAYVFRLKGFELSLAQPAE
ncbi:alpha-L-fucosidase [Thermostilla marina]